MNPINNNSTQFLNVFNDPAFKRLMNKYSNPRELALALARERGISQEQLTQLISQFQQQL